MQGILEKNIIIGLQAKDRNEAIMKLVEKLEANGHIHKSYYDDVIKREDSYPTGLPTEGVNIAIPHAKSDAIISSTIGFAVLETPVVFNNMADDSEALDVKIIFLIANSASAEQTVILQELMEKFSDEDILIALSKADTSKKVMELIGS